MSIDQYISAAVTAYIECALWSGLNWDNMDESDNPTPLDEEYDAGDVSDQAVADITAELTDFVTHQWDDVQGIDPAQCGHDFCLTRNHHGAGFWDRGLGDVGDRLTAACQPYGTGELYVGDDGKLYHS